MVLIIMAFVLFGIISLLCGFRLGATAGFDYGMENGYMEAIRDWYDKWNIESAPKLKELIIAINTYTFRSDESEEALNRFIKTINNQLECLNKGLEEYAKQRNDS